VQGGDSMSEQKKDEAKDITCENEALEEDEFVLEADDAIELWLGLDNREEPLISR